MEYISPYLKKRFSKFLQMEVTRPPAFSIFVFFGRFCWLVNFEFIEILFWNYFWSAFWNCFSKISMVLKVEFDHMSIDIYGYGKTNFSLSDNLDIWQNLSYTKCQSLCWYFVTIKDLKTFRFWFYSTNPRSEISVC